MITNYIGSLLANNPFLYAHNMIANTQMLRNMARYIQMLFPEYDENYVQVLIKPH